VNVLSPHVIDEIKALPARYPQPRSAVMPALDLAQEELGYLTPEAMSEVAVALQLDPGYVEGVATFYTLFHLQPIGKHRFYVCTNLSCSLRGSGEIVEHVKAAIGVKESGEVSADGLFSYEEVECLGACEFAPMMRLDHKYHYDLTVEKIDQLVAERRKPDSTLGRETPPPSGATTTPRTETAGTPKDGRGSDPIGASPQPAAESPKPKPTRKKKASG
jgi:NADH-quinone oxidoreductase subunit E